MNGRNDEEYDIVRNIGEYNSYAFTIRPRQGVSEEIQFEFEKYIVKNFKYYFLCAEKQDEERHLHGQVWMENSRKKGDFTKSLKRVQERTDPDWSPASAKVLASGVKIAYSRDWIEEYLAKEDDWILNNPPGLENKFYPTKEEQESVRAKANAVDPGFHHWSVLYKESQYSELPLTKETVGKWFHDAMFVSKKIKVQIDPKRRIQNRDCLFQYIKANSDSWKTTFKSREEQEHDKFLAMAIEMEADP